MGENSELEWSTRQFREEASAHRNYLGPQCLMDFQLVQEGDVGLSHWILQVESSFHKLQMPLHSAKIELDLCYITKF